MKSSQNHLQISGDFDIADSGERGEIAIGAESRLRKNSELQNLIGEKHIGELSPYLFGHHFHSSLVRHTPHCGNLVRTSHMDFHGCGKCSPE